ncbi:MAG TPA: hypothetical protein VFY87_23200 [Geminicoccaceae bacterium]|nr:hypothetical protein [Geminicoccaceae bacterium]
MHGGAAGSGGQPGNRNALKHRRYAREQIAFRRLLRELAREARELVEIA